MNTDTLIIGGGLAGLALADALQRAGHDYLLVEARNRLGGRILGTTVEGVTFDLGPAWFWPGQPRIASLIARFGLTRFEQFAQGQLTYEDQNGLQRGQGYASMKGSYRLKGGLGALIVALDKSLPGNKVITDTPISSLRQKDGKIFVSSGEFEASANRVVLALPPRLAAEMYFVPALAETTIAAMQSTPTWMAGQAKAVAVYDRPFWRDAGLSGDAMSRVGPMVEVHDASPERGGPYALFGFIGMSPDARHDETRLRDQLIAQLGRLFGPEAEKPRELFVKDWSFDAFTSTQADLYPPTVHPHYGLPARMSDVWQGRLLFGGTEVALEFGGYLEGALEAAESAFARLTKKAMSARRPCHPSRDALK